MQAHPRTVDPEASRKCGNLLQRSQRKADRAMYGFAPPRSGPREQTPSPTTAALRNMLIGKGGRICDSHLRNSGSRVCTADRHPSGCPSGRQSWHRAETAASRHTSIWAWCWPPDFGTAPTSATSTVRRWKPTEPEGTPVRGLQSSPYDEGQQLLWT